MFIDRNKKNLIVSLNMHRSKTEAMFNTYVQNIINIEDASLEDDDESRMIKD